MDHMLEYVLLRIEPEVEEFEHVPSKALTWIERAIARI